MVDIKLTSYGLWPKFSLISFWKFLHFSNWEVDIGILISRLIWCRPVSYTSFARFMPGGVNFANHISWICMSLLDSIFDYNFLIWTVTIELRIYICTSFHTHGNAFDISLHVCATLKSQFQRTTWAKFHVKLGEKQINWRPSPLGQKVGDINLRNFSTDCIPSSSDINLQPSLN